MADTSVRVEANKDGIAELLTRSETAELLTSKANDVLDAARAHAPMVEGEPGAIALPLELIEADEDERARRMVAANHPAALAVETKHRLLGSSLDAAKGF